MTDNAFMPILSNPSLNLFFDMKNSVFFKQNEKNLIYSMTAKQLPVSQSLALLDIYMSQGHIVEPHWHPNAVELVYTIKGEAIISVLNPFTLQLLTYRVVPPQVVSIPMGWWHWEIAAVDNTQLLAIFDNGNPLTVFGSDVLMKTPKEVFERAYCVNGDQLEQVLKPITDTVVLGPSANCAQTMGASSHMSNASPYSNVSPSMGNPNVSPYSNANTNANSYATPYQPTPQYSNYANDIKWRVGAQQNQ